MIQFKLYFKFQKNKKIKKISESSQKTKFQKKYFRDETSSISLTPEAVNNLSSHWCTAKRFTVQNIHSILTAVAIILVTFCGKFLFFQVEVIRLGLFLVTLVFVELCWWNFKILCNWGPYTVGFCLNYRITYEQHWTNFQKLV